MYSHTQDSVRTPELHAPATPDQRPRFGFRARSSRLNWKALAALDSSRLVSTGDVSALQSIMENLCFSQIHPTELECTPTDQISKLVSTLQHSLELVFALYARSYASNEELVAESQRKSQTISKLTRELEAANARIIKLENAPCDHCVDLSEQLAKSLTANAAIASSVEKISQSATLTSGHDDEEHNNSTEQPLATIAPYAQQKAARAQGRSAPVIATHDPQVQKDLGHISRSVDGLSHSNREILEGVSALLSASSMKGSEEAKNRSWWISQFQQAVETAIARSVAKSRGSYIVPDSLTEVTNLGSQSLSAHSPSRRLVEENSDHEMLGHSQLIDK